MIDERKIAKNVAAEVTIALSEKQEEYRAFFQKKLKEFGVNSPDDLSTEEKKKFFNEIDSEWSAEEETD